MIFVGNTVALCTCKWEQTGLQTCLRSDVIDPVECQPRSCFVWFCPTVPSIPITFTHHVNRWGSSTVPISQMIRQQMNKPMWKRENKADCAVLHYCTSEVSVRHWRMYFPTSEHRYLNFVLLTFSIVEVDYGLFLFGIIVRCIPASQVWFQPISAHEALKT